METDYEIAMQVLGKMADHIETWSHLNKDEMMDILDAMHIEMPYWGNIMSICEDVMSMSMMTVVMKHE